MAGIPKIKGAKKIAKTEVVPFTRQLASMIGAGMPILSTIQTLEEQCSNPEFKKVLTHLKDTIEGGDPLSRGLAAFPVLFDDMYVNMVVAGEQSGEFAGILKRLGSIMQATARLRGKVKSAMTYPTVIVSIALLLAAGLIQFVVPIFAEMFSGFGKPLPALTQTLVDISDFVKGNWYYVLGAVVVAVLSFRKWKSTERGHYQFDEFKLKMPVFGQLNLKSGIGRFCRLLAQMTNAGVPILKSLEVVARSIGNRVLEKSILDARKEVEQGNQLNVALDGKPYMPIIMVRMIAAGEKAGKVEDMLDSVADSYDEEVEALLSTLTALMEPFLMVFLGAIIGTIVMAMFMPIFNMGSLAS
ncbi:MAG: type II secretion system F family protein [Kiritimatiellae bacterium]|nr:type II secretion system F family protein [Kiritimatiellia bacterium]